MPLEILRKQQRRFAQGPNADFKLDVEETCFCNSRLTCMHAEPGSFSGAEKLPHLHAFSSKVGTSLAKGEVVMPSGSVGVRSETVQLNHVELGSGVTKFRCDEFAS